MRHPIVQQWIDGENDTGGTIASLETALQNKEEQVVAMEKLLDDALVICGINPNGLTYKGKLSAFVKDIRPGYVW